MKETALGDLATTISMVDCHIRLETWADRVAEKMKMRGKQNAVGECR